MEGGRMGGTMRRSKEEGGRRKEEGGRWGPKKKQNHHLGVRKKIEKVVFFIRRMRKVGQNDPCTGFEGYPKIYLGKHTLKFSYEGFC